MIPHFFLYLTSLFISRAYLCCAYACVVLFLAEILLMISNFGLMRMRLEIGLGEALPSPEVRKGSDLP